MRIKTMSYKRIFPIASFCNETIGIEVELEEGENEDEVFEQIKAKVMQWGAEKSQYELVDRNPPLPVDQIQFKKPTPNAYDGEKMDKYTGDEYGHVPKLTPLAEQILSCNSLKILKIYEPLIKKQEKSKQAELWVLYEKKKEELIKGEVVK